MARTTTPPRPIRRWLHAAAFLVLATTPYMSALAAVSVDQSPATLQSPVAPNVMLMMDDSASMAWDFMPDAEYLLGSLTGTDTPSDDDLRAYQVNGIYYNPNITYTPPLKADGSSYPNASITSLLSDGFHPQGYRYTLGNGTQSAPNDYQNILQYDGDPYWYGAGSDSVYPGSDGGFPYYKQISIAMPSGQCPTGTTDNGDGTCTASPTSSAPNISCPSDYTYDSGDKLCHYSGTPSAKPASYKCSSGTLNGSTCYICPKGTGYNKTSGQCTSTITPAYYTCPPGTTSNTNPITSSSTCTGSASGTNYSCSPASMTYNSSTGTCSSAATPASTSCPYAGMSLNTATNTCTMAATPAGYTCPSGLNNNNNGTCSAPAQGGYYYCPNGFNLSGTTCSMYLVGEQCPPGSTLSNGYCTQAASYSPPTCSVGKLSPDKTTCTASATSYPASCQYGSLSTDKTTCTATATTTPAGCSGGGTLSADQTTCTGTVNPPHPYCPVGTLSGTTCTATPQYHAGTTCPTGTSLSADGETCTATPSSTDATPYCKPSPPYLYQTSGTYVGQCYASSATTKSPGYSCPSGSTKIGNPPTSCETCPAGSTYNSKTKQCSGSPTYACPSGWEAYDNSTKCLTDAFSFNKGTHTTGYTSYYVVPTSTGCQGTPNCGTQDDTSGTFAPAGIPVETNVANWFSYYRNRMLLAKTSMSFAFDQLNSGFRFGFGSINGSNINDITSLPHYDFKTDTKSGNALAEVEPFGKASDATSQRINFWNWLIGVYPISQTPLREALNAVGQYYETAQPWETSDIDKSMIACRASATIMTTDGFYNDNQFTGVGGNVDGSTQAAITTPSTYQYTPTLPFSDNYSDTLADVAMKYWATDLRPGLDNDVKTTLQDPAYWQHMTTYTVGLGWDPAPLLPTGVSMPDILNWAQTGTPPTSYSGSKLWPQPDGSGQGVIQNIADLAHAAVDGHGNFFSVKNPVDLINGLKSALSSISDTQGAGNAVTNSADALPSGTTTSALYQFRATYFTGQWTGNLTESHWDTTTTPPAFKLDWSTSSWSPSFINVGGVTLSGRNVWTDGSTGSIPFRTASTLTAQQQTGLSAYSGVSAQQMLNYLLGDTTYDTSHVGGTLRARKAILGDVVSSTPVYVAAPDPDLYENATFTGASSYSSFVTSNTNRTPLVWVAANDGMLHAIRVTAGAGWAYDPTTGLPTPQTSQPAGTEVYAYMPSAVLTQTGNANITNLANPQYGVADAVSGTQTVPHQYYNDGRITVQNVYFSTDSKWHTVLVGTTGRGPAKAIYALDITDPSVLMNPATAATALLWERSAGDGQAGSNYIGQMVGVPVIAQVKQGSKSSWAVFVGNGYNSAANTAALLQFNLQTGALTVHTTNSTADNGLAEPGLMQPTVANGISTYAFAGDLKGNLWKFDLGSATSAGSVAFVAKDADGNTQPITSLVSLAYDNTTNSTFALFGTGQYLAQTDISNTQTQTWYGIRVGVGTDLSGTATTVMPVASNSTTRANLTQRFAVDDGKGNRATSLQTTNDMNDNAGWFMDLPQSGERIINRTQFIGGQAVVTTLMPKASDLCSTVPSGAVMWVNPFTGANSTTDFGLGTQSIAYKDASGKTVTTTVAINGQVFPSGPAGGVTGVAAADGTITLSFNTLSGGLQTLGPLTLNAGTSGRISWRELNN